MARPKKPLALKQLHGTDKRNKTRVNNDQPIPERGIGEAPDHFTDVQRATWDEIVSQIYPGVLGEGDRLALETLTRLVVRMRTGFEMMPDATVANMTRLFGQFGMTPSSRNNIRVKQKKPNNPFSSV